MTLFSKFTKSNNSHSEKSVYPWAQRKLSGSSHALPRFGHGATMIDNQHFIVFGGIYTKGNTKKNGFIVDINSMSASSISTSGDIPSLRSSATMTTIGGFILLYGGEPIIPGEIWDPYFYVLHMNTKQWSRVRTKGTIPSERSGHSTCVSNDGMMYVWGGHYQRKYLNDLCAFNVREYPTKAEWDFIAYQNEGPAPRSGHISVIYDNKLYIFGGINASHLFNDIWYLDLSNHRWHQISAVGYIPAPRESCSAALIDDTIYVFGGKGLNGCGLGDLCAYRIKSQRWYMFQNMGSPPSPRYGSSMTVINHKIYVFGGDSVSGKTEDSGYVYILDCSKIKYPPEPEPTISEKSNVERANNRRTQDHYDDDEEQVDPMIQLTKSPIHMRPLPASPTKRQFEQEDSKLNSPIRGHAMESNIHQDRQHEISSPPPRPPRKGATLTDIYRADPKHQRESLQKSNDNEEKIQLMREIMTRDLMITEMKKKEQWWRTEVSIARHNSHDHLEDSDFKEAKLMDFTEEGVKNITNDKLLLFQQLVNMKAEIKKVKTSLGNQIEPIALKMEDAENVRTIALQEAAYYKAKYVASKNRDENALNALEANRVQVLEDRLNKAYVEKTKIEQGMHQIQTQSKHDKAARLLAEERAKDAQAESEKAQVAHQKALEELSELYQQMMKAEAQTREDALTIANLSNDIASHLSMEYRKDVSHVQLEIGRLEAANIKSRNQIAVLSKKLEESKDEEMNLRILLNEREHAYNEAILEMEKVCIELELLKSASSPPPPTALSSTVF